ncbi:hypothetical protein L6452_06772 [Arctium lappa]|uniref:Uncharacterized protein n=1 Tax=Arctium lappa TaxID=4217 RepID=A0ACB9EJK1_ARCLA|nr:hypothetical protein L6452_06772 [Arctium lappa]
MEMEMEKLRGKSMEVVTEKMKIFGEDQKTILNSKSNSWQLDSCSSLRSYGSMRKEMEWKLILACKLFEKWHNSEGGGEGMDSLWKAYENDHSTTITKSKNTKVDRHGQTEEDPDQ